MERTSPEEVMDLFQMNFFAAVGACQAVLPPSAPKGGTIVNVSSIGGRIGLPFHGVYSASKFALEGLTEALRMAVKPFGVRVVLVEPRDIRPPFTAHRRLAAAGEGDPYRKRFARALRQVKGDEEAGGKKAAVARLVLPVLRHPNPRLRYTVGNPVQRLAVAARGILPGRLFEWGIMRYCRLT